MARQALMPPFAYYGGKTTLAPIIASLLPPHDHYVEPFAGSLAVLLAKVPSSAETVNDLDGDLVTFWRALRDRPVDLERACAMTPHSREEYAASASLGECGDLERARRVFVRLTQGRSLSMSPTGWKVSRNAAAKGFSQPAYLRAYVERFAPVAERLSAVTLENRDALDLIRDYGSEPTVCIYADPPYLGSTRAANYRHELLGDDLHIRLADALNGCKASVILSGYDSPLYADLYAGWQRTELKAPTSLSGGAAQTEVLWSNVPLASQDVLDFGESA